MDDESEEHLESQLK